MPSLKDIDKVRQGYDRYLLGIQYKANKNSQG